ncbi:MAG TPA: 1,4-alpha-glucan branching protein GlgB [Clostridia bacterium]|nr:1,4-alpha-glucan branching protein GlgB [Clostridia bacterium]
MNLLPALEDLRAYREGTFYEGAEHFGAQYIQDQFRFLVYAPRAKEVSVVGEWNQWTPGVDPMKPIEEGYYYAFIPEAREGHLYKYHILDQEGKEIWKTDPYARKIRWGQEGAGIIYRSKDFDWQAKIDIKENLTIYEVHLGSWKKKEDGTYLSFQELAHSLLPYVEDLGYKAIELLPVTEHPYDGSWGYQQTGYFAITSRHGDPWDFKYFVEEAHKRGLAVFLDWVPCHFAKDAPGLSYFDGSALYESDFWEDAYNSQWDTINFDFGRRHVCNFLIGNLFFLWKEYGIDGIRVDAVAHMLYREEGLKNIHDHSLNFLQELTTALKGKILLFAEDSSDYEGITKAVSKGGLGFDYKWNMGWMNDTLRYIGLNGYAKTHKHNLLTFPMVYAFSERFVLPLSHDEVVHMKGSLLTKTQGTYEEKFSQLRLLHLYQYAMPGKKLLFMGGEFGQFAEWNAFTGLDWNLLDFYSHLGVQTFVRDLNLLYHKKPALYENDQDWKGFNWIEVDNPQQNFIAFKRIDLKGNEVMVLLNFSSKELFNHKLDIKAGKYRILINSDAEEYGGKARGSKSPVMGESEIYIGLAPYSGMILEVIND